MPSSPDRSLVALAAAPALLLGIPDLEAWARSVMESLGYVGIAGLVAVENLIPPIPSEVVLPLAGFFVSRGTFTYAAVVVAATVGSVVGAWALYGVGLWLGKDRLHAIVEDHGHLLMVRTSDLDRSFGWFHRHGREAVLFGRLVPIVRSLISIPAGLDRMALGRFTLYTALGSGIWNALLVGFGWWLGQEWELVARWLTVFEGGVAVVFGVLVLAFLVHRWWSSQHR